MRSLLAWFCLLLPATFVPAQDPAPEVVCRVCRNTGSSACNKHGKMLAAEQAIVQCSVVTECKTCSGALAVDCKVCENPDSDRELQRRRAAAAAWLVGRRQAIDEVAKREPYLHLKTAHVDLSFGMKGATIGKEKFDPHQRMHLYGERLEQLRTLFMKTLEIDESEMPGRLLVAMSEEAKDHEILGPKLTGIGTSKSSGLKLMGPEFVYSMYQDRRAMPDDEAVHRNIVHSLTHVLLSQVPPIIWIGNKGHGWIDEGVSHWFEDKVLGTCTNFCYEEIRLAAGAGFKAGKWRPAIRKLADEGKLPVFAALSAKRTDELSFPEHATSFAYVDFLLTSYGGAKFRDFVKLIKNDVATREAMQQVFNLTPLTIDAIFVEWVKANYSPLPQ